MLRVGLTGGIACGKSTVAALLRELGCTVIEADILAHQLIEPGQPAYAEVVHEFGQQIVGSDGRIDRKRLGAIVFADFEKLACLNRIVHPRVIDAVEGRLAELERDAAADVVVVEAALLVEAGYHARMDRLVVVWCQPEQQLERLVERGIEFEQARRRVAAQMPLEEKRRIAHDEIDCSGSLAETRRQVERVVTKLKQLAAGK